MREEKEEEEEGWSKLQQETRELAMMSGGRVEHA